MTTIKELEALAKAASLEDEDAMINLQYQGAPILRMHVVMNQMASAIQAIKDYETAGGPDFLYWDKYYSDLYDALVAYKGLNDE